MLGVIVQGKRRLVFSSLLLLSLFLWENQSFGQGKWVVNTSFEFSRGKFIFSTPTNAYYFYSGLRYVNERWSISASIPFVMQSTNLVTSVGGMLIPHGNSQQMMGSRMSQSMTGGSSLIFGLGDLYASGTYEVFHQNGFFPGVYASLQVKAPTGSTADNFSTGKFDFGAGISFREIFESYAGFSDFRYLSIGKVAGLNYINPFIFGVGVGKSFNSGQYSLLVYYQNYTRIISGYSPPRSLALGFNYKIELGTVISVIASAGLSQTSPSIGFSAGLSHDL